MSRVTGKRSPRWAFMSRMEIPSLRNDGEVYLSRLRIIQTPWFGVYVHNVNEPDYDKDMHDHPWNFASFILRGSYTEEIDPYPHLFPMDPTRESWSIFKRRWNRFTWHKMPRERAHRIISVDPGTISLIFTGKRHGNWGFYTPTGWVPWDKYERLLQ